MMYILLSFWKYFLETNSGMYFGCDVNLFEWIFEFLHFCFACLNGCGTICSMIKIFTLNFYGFVPFWDCHALPDPSRCIWGRDRSWYQSMVECGKFLCIHHSTLSNAFDWI